MKLLALSGLLLKICRAAIPQISPNIHSGLSIIVKISEEYATRTKVIAQIPLGLNR